jgi:diacylglycerol kinase family enzyme
MTSVMNGRRMGGGFMMAPEASPDDGLLDFCIASEASRLRLFQLISHFLKGTQATQPEVKMHRARTASIRAIEGTLPAHADGEMLCVQGKQLDLELIPAALDFVTLKSDSKVS